MKLKPLLIVGVLIVIGLAVIGNDDDQPGQSSGPDCSPVSSSTLATIEEGLIHTDTSLSRGAALRDGEWWYVAAEIDGGVTDGAGDVGVWALSQSSWDGDSGLIIMANAFAREFSQWGTQTGAENAGVWQGAAIDAADCL